VKIHLASLPSALPDNTYVALDVELFGAETHRLHRPTGRFACLTLCPDGENVYMITDEKIIPMALGRIDNCVWVFHNAQFDLQHLRRWADVPPRKKLWCTMIIERLLWSGYYDRFSLKDVVRRYLDTYVEKDTVELFATATELNEDMINYAGLDAVLTWKVVQKQIKKVKKRPDVWKIWKEIDNPATWAYLDFIGFRIDVKQWEALAIQNKTKAEELKASFDFNPASPIQVKKDLKSTGFTNIASTGAKVLNTWISKKPNTKAAETAKRVLEFRKVFKLSSTYGMSMIDKHVENENDYQVIYSNFKVVGASSGRNSSSNPNLQNIPIRTHPIFRKPWIARPGHKLIVADWSAQEVRIHAYLSKDKQLLEIFESGKDPYIETAKRVYGREIEKDDPYRDVMKSSFLGATYGQTPQGLEHNYGIPLDEGEELLDTFWRGFPDSDEWCYQQRGKMDYVESVMGRRFWANIYNDARERNNLNHPHQATAADMMKLSIVKIHQNWNFDCPYGAIAPVHDELILDVPEELAPDVARFVSNTMVEVAETMCPGVPFKADAKIVDNWLEGK